MNVRTAIQFRELPESDIERALALAYLAFHESPEDDQRRRHRDLLRQCLRIGAYDGDEVVGLAAGIPFRLSVPGAELPGPGVSFVCVAPTHRRRGVLSGMIGELFRRCADAGWPVASLWASEDAIYGRYGFGPAAYGATVEIDSREALRLRIAPDERPLRLLATDEVPKLLGAYYDATRRTRAGRPFRTEEWWREEWLVDKDEDDDDLSPPRVVALGDPVAGYAVYRTKRADDGPGLVRVDELEADTPAAAAALWTYLCAIDLTRKVQAWNRPLDDPLLLFAADRDQVRVTAEFPALRLRLTDAAEALRQREWAAPADLVLDVTDAHIPANAGRHRLTAAPGGATYEPTDAAPDLALDVRDLAACYLGGTRARSLVQAGLVTEHTPGAADALDDAFRTALLPHTGEDF
ncbi:GNAT family N-acetyltransferase [Streptomyces sp. A7024]|uniref:GNAT family N-acetyltransferase n=1 Tax=Streptomyces coryli TaxID=1128680 RepID=A0A6G4TUB3_9ACTN|nr:GNAT family N-acetyltransferase [Streptomyces coryli]NGN63362.1 GNAT family N-acetyltransferase [Streptomyces coryli]